MASISSDGDAPARSSSFEITLRVARYAYDRLTFAGPLSAVGLGTAAVFGIGAAESRLHLKPPTSSSYFIRSRFIARYAVYHIVPSLIWGTHAPSAIVKSSNYLSSTMKPLDSWLYQQSSGTPLPPKRVLWTRILCALRGAVAGSVVLSNVIALTSLWERARQEYADRIQRGREPPLEGFLSSSLRRDDGCTIRLAGVHSNVTELSLYRRGSHHLWPVYENPDTVEWLVSKYATEHQHASSHQRQQLLVELLPRVPVYWQVDNGEYSKESSWEGMRIPDRWLFSVNNGKRMLYLEADATSGDESALSLQDGAYYYKKDKRENSKWQWVNSLREKTENIWVLDETPFPDLDLDLKEVAQGFRRLADLAKQENDSEMLEVRRILLVDPTLIIESGGGRQSTVRDRLEELGLADIIVDARALVLHAILQWLETAYDKNDDDARKGRLKPVILETPSKVWFHSIRSELRRHGYHVIDRAQAAGKEGSPPPMLVYEHSSADTVHTIRHYLEQGIVKDPSSICALLTCHDGLDEVKLLNDSLATNDAGERSSGVGCVCSSDIYDRAFEWVREKCIKGIPPQKIQEELDAGSAWKE